MSADNWGVCPKCKIAAAVATDKAIQAAAKAYGKVPAHEYERLKADAASRPALQQNLREDYEIRTSSDGEFFVSYSCSCRDCGFKHAFKHEEQVNLD